MHKHDSVKDINSEEMQLAVYTLVNTKVWLVDIKQAAKTKFLVYQSH